MDVKQISANGCTVIVGKIQLLAQHSNTADVTLPHASGIIASTVISTHCPTVNPLILNLLVPS